jgi:hypothetical protein
MAHAFLCSFVQSSTRHLPFPVVALLNLNLVRNDGTQWYSLLRWEFESSIGVLLLSLHYRVKSACVVGHFYITGLSVSCEFILLKLSYFMDDFVHVACFSVVLGLCLGAIEAKCTICFRAAIENTPKGKGGVFVFLINRQRFALPKQIVDCINHGSCF